MGLTPLGFDAWDFSERYKMSILAHGNASDPGLHGN